MATQNINKEKTRTARLKLETYEKAKELAKLKDWKLVVVYEKAIILLEQSIKKN